MVPQRTSRPLEELLAEWEEGYRNRTYMLAKHSAEEATERHSESHHAWYALGMSNLALRDARSALTAFDKLADMLTAGAGTRPRGGDFKNLGRCVAILLEEIRAKRLQSAPADPYTWLADPETIRGVPTALAGISNKPLGRSAALPPRILGSYLSGVLSGDLRIEPIRRDSMKSLLGKDLDIKIERPGTVDIQMPVPLDVVPVAEKAPAVQLGGILAPGGRRLADIKRSEALPPSPARVRPPSSPSPVHEPRPSRSTTVYPQPAAPKGASAVKEHAAKQWDQWEKDIDEMLRRGKSHEALGRVEEALGQFPNSSRLEEIHARALARAGHLDAAVKAYANTYRKAVQNGADERANRAYQEAFALARENGDLLLDLAALVGAAGGVGLALATTKTAADIYRRRGDRPKLLDALKRLRLLDPNQPDVEEDIRRTERDLGAMAPAAPAPKASLSIPPPPSGGKTYGRVAPPGRPSAAPRKGQDSSVSRPAAGTAQTADDWRRQRAADANIEAALPTQSQNDPAPVGVAMVIGSVILLLFALGTGSGFLGLLGAGLTHAYVQAVVKKGNVKTLQAAKAARTICIIAFILGIIF